MVTMSVGDAKLSDDVVSVAFLARKNVIENLDAGLDGEGFTGLNLWNRDLDVIQEELGLISVAGLKVESFGVGPLGSVLESELDFHHVTSPSSENATWLFDDDGTSRILSALLFGLTESLLGGATHLLLAEEVLHEPADLLLHSLRIHTGLNIEGL